MAIKDELLGKPMLERIDFIKNSLINSTDFIYEIIIFSGGPHQTKIKVFMVDIDFPIYRLKNIRTKGPQQSYKATNDIDDDFFSRDGESREALSIQHELLLKIADSKNETSASVSHVATFDIGNYDLAQPMIISSSGVLINGNTRMSALRHLFNSDPVKYSRYAKIPMAILPSNFSEKDFRKLELNLQINPELRKEYSWISEAQDCKEQVEFGVDIESLSHEYGRRSSEPGHPKNLLNQLKIAELFLKNYNNYVMDYNRIEKDQFALWAWYNWRSTHDNDLDKQFQVDLICGQMINKPEGCGNLYKNINSKAREWRLDPSLYSVQLKQVANDLRLTKLGNVDGTEIIEPKINSFIESSNHEEGEPLNDFVKTKAKTDIEEEDEYGFLNDFVQTEEKTENTEISDKELIETIKKNIDSGNIVDMVAAADNVLLNKFEEEKRSKDLNLIYRDAIEIKEKAIDCYKRFETSEHKFKNLTEAIIELKAAEINIKALYELIENTSYES